MAFYYDADDYFLGFNRENQPSHEIDDSLDGDENLTYEQRKQRWEKAPWAYPEDDWLFKSLPSEFVEF